MMKNEPLKSQLHFYEHRQQKTISIPNKKVKDLLKETREEIYASNPAIALSEHFCKTEDYSCSQTFMQFQGETSIPSLNQNNVAIKRPFIIFAFISMLKQLEERAWFVDATFSVVPSGFYQLLTILVYDTSTKTYVPAAFVLMGSKHQTIYEMAFQALKTVCRSNNINLQPTHIMSNFEATLCNSLRIV